MGRFERALHEHLPEWVDDGTIRAEQADALRAKHPLHDEDRSGRTVTVLVSAGAALIGVGIILWVATNWAQIPGLLRVLMLTAVTAAAYALGWNWIHGDRFQKTGHAMLLIGAAAYGGTIFQIANTYHLPAHNSMLILVWLVGVAATAYATRSPGLAILSILLVPVYLPMWFVEADLRHSTWFMLGLMAGGWGLMGIGLWHGKKGPLGWRYLYLVPGILLTWGVFFVLTFFEDPLLLWAPQRYDDVGVGWQPLLAVAVGLVLAGVGAMRVLRDGRWQAAIVAAGVVLPLVAFLAGEKLISNLLFPIGVLGLALLAIMDRDELVFTLAIGLFVIEIIGRYFEFVADLGNASLAFILGGLLLLGLGFVAEKVRRMGRDRIREESV